MKKKSISKHKAVDGNVDPHALREASKYQNPIASREFILEYIKKRGMPLSFKELKEGLQLETEEHCEALRRRLKAMVRDSQLDNFGRRRFWPASENILLAGTTALDRKQDLWLIPEDGSARVFLTNAKELAVHLGSKVVVSVPNVADKLKREGKIVEVLQEAKSRITGRFIEEDGFNYVVSFSKDVACDILIPAQKQGKAKHGDIVSVELLKTVKPNWHQPIGEVVELIGSENAKGIEIQTIVYGYDLPHQFPTSLKKELEQLPRLDSIKHTRVDLTTLPFVTIDGEDARDFDDAVYCCKLQKAPGFKLFVAIADVSFYVKPNTELDQIASERGNSVYFPQMVIPMLPEKLSNDLCSLKPKVERLALVCEMNIADDGSIEKYKFYEAVIKSHARLTYTEVANLLEFPHEKKTKYKDLMPHLLNLHDLYLCLSRERAERGAIDFETRETKIVFDSKGKISKIMPVTRNIAHKIIEEAMLCANVATAKFIAKYKVPGIYRVHEAPPQEKLHDLKTFLRSLGLSFTGDIPTAQDYVKILLAIKNRPDADVIQTILLRSLSQAVYSPDNIGHFGLAYASYTHFTSPIRRYPDLIVHRQIKNILQGKHKLTKKEKDEQIALFDKIAAHCSFTERRADDATREVIKWLKCLYIKKYIGQKFTGVISAVTKFGFFVELLDLYIEGLVHVATLKDDYYVYNQAHHEMRGERTGIVYALGKQVEVIVSRVDVDERKIDLDLDFGNRKKASNKKQKRKKSKRR